MGREKTAMTDEVNGILRQDHSADVAERLIQQRQRFIQKNGGDVRTGTLEFVAWYKQNKIKELNPREHTSTRPDVPTGEPIYTMLYGFVAGAAAPFLFVHWRIVWSSLLWPAAIAIFYTLTTSLGWPGWAILVLFRHKLCVVYGSAGVGAALVVGYLVLALAGVVAWPR